MPDLTPEIVDAVVAACAAGADEAAEAFSRALDAQISLSVGQPETLATDNLPEGLDGPGLAVVLKVGEAAALVLLPESSGLLPAWIAAPDPTGQSKLTTLAQELGMLVLPEEHESEDGQAGRVTSLAEALRRGDVGDGAGMVPLEMTAEEAKGIARVIWPASRPDDVLQPAAATPPEEKADAPDQGEPAAEPQPEPAAKPQPEPAAEPQPESAAEGKARHSSARELPDYTRSLLRIKVPVVVTLAEKRQPLRRIVELGAGSIIQFKKSCEEMLELNVGGHRVAKGEAVKVGDKFGLRIHSMVLPDERFRPLRPRR